MMQRNETLTKRLKGQCNPSQNDSKRATSQRQRVASYSNNGIATHRRMKLDSLRRFAMNVVKMELVGNKWNSTIVASNLTADVAKAKAATLNNKRDPGSRKTESQAVAMVSYVVKG